MRLFSRLMVVVGGAVLFPIVVLGWGAIKVATDKISDEVSSQQAQFVDGMALYVQTWLELHVRLVKQLARGFELESLSPDERAGFVRLVLHQVPEARIAALVDPGGRRIHSETTLRTGAPDAAQQAWFLDHLPLAELQQALSEGRDVVVGRPYVPPESDVAVFPVVLRAAPSLVLAIELGLGPIADKFGETALVDQDLALLDDVARIVIVGKAGLVDAGRFKRLAEVGGGEGCADDIRYQAANGTDVIAACAYVPGPRWMVVVAEPTDSRLETTKRFIASRTAFLALWGIAFATVIVSVFGRQIARPVTVLTDAALRVADGKLGLQVPPQGTGEVREIAELASAFNYMSTRLRQNRDTIDQKNREIEAFNVELQDRVEERTRELKEAQEHLIQSARLAAVGEMGAGLAHELNNPLAGILGMVQVVMSKLHGHPEATMLRVIEEQTVRCTQIVAHLLRFSRPEPLPGTERGEWDEVELHEVVNEVLGLVRAPFQQRGVTVEHDQSGGPLRVRGHRAQLGQALAQLLTSLRGLTESGHRITIVGIRGKGQIELLLAVHGRTPERTSDDWMASGMGFWVANRVLVDHGGQLIEPAKTGSDGRVWRILLPEA